MKKFACFIVAFSLTLISLPAFAEQVSFSWNPAAERANGDPVAPSEIVNYRIQCGTASGGPYTFAQYLVAGNLNFFTSPDDFTPDTYFCQVGALLTNPDDPTGPALEPAEYSAEQSFTIASCTAATCGSKALTGFTATVL